MKLELDFSNSEVNLLKLYGGANGNKIGIMYKGEAYMLKFPPKPKRNPDLSYTNSCISEYVACRIFECLGVESQKTILGRYGDKVTVACKDFESDGFILKDFASLKNSIVDSEQNGYGTDLEDILKTINEQQIISPKQLKSFFWQMFIGDALLGNFDRHNGNWGFLINGTTGEVKIAPVFDCGSCLYPQMDEPRMAYVISNKKEIEDRIFTFPNSAINQNGGKLNYYHFLMTTEDKDCHRALETIGTRVDLSKINTIVDNTPFISDAHKLFLKTMIKERKEKIIDKALERTIGAQRRLHRDRER